jgi:hypothetical protein
MLSDAELRELTAIESHLREDDPQFAQRLSNGWNQPSPAGGWSGWSAALTAMVCVAVAVVGLVALNVAMVVIAMTALGGNAGLWITGRRRAHR